MTCGIDRKYTTLGFIHYHTESLFKHAQLIKHMIIIVLPCMYLNRKCISSAHCNCTPILALVKIGYKV